MVDQNHVQYLSGQRPIVPPRVESRWDAHQRRHRKLWSQMDSSHLAQRYSCRRGPCARLALALRAIAHGHRACLRRIRPLCHDWRWPLLRRPRGRVTSPDHSSSGSVRPMTRARLCLDAHANTPFSAARRAHLSSKASASQQGVLSAARSHQHSPRGGCAAEWLCSKAFEGAPRAYLGRGRRGTAGQAMRL